MVVPGAKSTIPLKSNFSGTLRCSQSKRPAASWQQVYKLYSAAQQEFRPATSDAVYIVCNHGLWIKADLEGIVLRPPVVVQLSFFQGCLRQGFIGAKWFASLKLVESTACCWQSLTWKCLAAVLQLASISIFSAAADVASCAAKRNTTAAASNATRLRSTLFSAPRQNDILAKTIETTHTGLSSGSRAVKHQAD
jgi:hypothetical protein